MTDSSVSIFIGFHDIKLRAEMSSDLICIAVFPRVISLGLGRHQDSIEGCDTATTHLAQVDIVFESASKHIGHEIFRGIELFLRRKIDSVIVVEV